MNVAEAFEKVIGYLNGSLCLYGKITAARLSGEGIAVRLLGGRDRENYLDGGRLRSLPLLFLAKSDSGRKALSALTQIVSALEKALPDGFCAMETDSSPSFVDKGERYVLYEAQVTVYYYQKDAAE